MKILRGCCRIIGGDTSSHGFAPMVMKRFEIIEKLYLSKALLKMDGGGCIPHIPPLALGMPLNVCLLVLRLLFEKFTGAAHGQKHKYGMGAPTSRELRKKYIES